MEELKIIVAQLIWCGASCRECVGKKRTFLTKSLQLLFCDTYWNSALALGVFCAGGVQGGVWPTGILQLMLLPVLPSQCEDLQLYLYWAGWGCPGSNSVTPGLSLSQPPCPGVPGDRHRGERRLCCSSSVPGMGGWRASPHHCASRCRDVSRSNTKQRTLVCMSLGNTWLILPSAG